jgi:hypothetical protein
VLTKYHGRPGSGALDFLSEYFGKRFYSTLTKRLAGEKLYRKAGRQARRPLTQTRPNFSLTLNVTPQLLAGYTNLIRLSPAQETSTPGKEGVRGEKHPVLVVQAERSSVSPRRAAREPRELKELLTVHERIAREIFCKVKLETVRERDVTGGLITRHETAAHDSPPGRPNISLTPQVRTLLLSQATRAALISGTPPESHGRGAQPATAMLWDLITRAYVSLPSSDAFLSKAVPHATVILSERAEHADKMAARFERTFFRMFRWEGRGGLAPSEKKFAGAYAAPLFGGNASDFIGPAPTLRRALYERGAGESTGAEALSRPPAFRSSLTAPEYDLTRKALVLRAGGRLISESHADLYGALVTLRREARLELPPVARVFAPQPQRAAVDGGNVVKQVEEKEVIETIKREVTSQMKSYSAAATFTRADFTAITDHVYDALARRLLNERERLGLSS